MVAQNNASLIRPKSYGEAFRYFVTVAEKYMPLFKSAECLLRYYTPVAVMADAGQDEITFRLVMVNPLKDCPLAIDLSIGVINNSPPVCDFTNAAGRPLQCTPKELVQYIKSQGG